MSNKLTAFFKPKPTAPEPEMIYWKTVKAGPDGTTARIEVNVKARVGSYVQHVTHGKAMLVDQPAPDKLEIEISTDTSSWPAPGGIINTREIVDAADCSNPQGVARARDATVYMDNSVEAIAGQLVAAALATASRVADEACGVAAGKAKAKAAPAGKRKGKATATGAGEAR